MHTYIKLYFGIIVKTVYSGAALHKCARNPRSNLALIGRNWLLSEKEGCYETLFVNNSVAFGIFEQNYRNRQHDCLIKSKSVPHNTAAEQSRQGKNDNRIYYKAA